MPDPSPFPARTYDIIYADPPWHFRGHVLKDGDASLHYPTVPTKVLKTWPVQTLAASACLLFLWTTSHHLAEAISLGQAWGFQYSTVAFVWDKQMTLVGLYTLPQTELCLVFKRGKIPTPRGARNVRQLVSIRRGRHSEKPDEVRQRITRMFPSQRKIELFARIPAAGWDSWGNEVSQTEAA